MARKELTDRQKEILEALEGRTVTEAAKKLGVKPPAVYAHIARIREAGHKVVLNGRSRRGNGTAPPPADLPPMREPASTATAKRNGTLGGTLARVDKETDAALEHTKSALDKARAEQDTLKLKLAEVEQVIEEHTTTLGVLADVSARLHDAPINT